MALREILWLALYKYIYWYSSSEGPTFLLGCQGVMYVLGLVQLFCSHASHLVMGLVIGLIYFITMDLASKRVKYQVFHLDS